MTDKNTTPDTTSERDAEQSQKTKAEDLPTGAKGKDVKGGGGSPGGVVNRKER